MQGMHKSGCGMAQNMTCSEQLTNARACTWRRTTIKTSDTPNRLLPEHAMQGYYAVTVSPKLPAAQQQLIAADCDCYCWAVTNLG